MAKLYASDLVKNARAGANIVVNANDYYASDLVKIARAAVVAVHPQKPTGSRQFVIH